MKKRWAALGAGVAVLGGVGLYLRPIAPIATGYAAKTVCSGHFISGRALDDVRDDLPGNPLVPFLAVDVDEVAGTSTATLFRVWSSTAWHTDGLGCTLADDETSFSPVAAASKDPWPSQATDVPSGVTDAIDAAFAEDRADGLLRNTRAVVVLRAGELVAERYADGFDSDTPLLGWSMTKSVANTMVGRLVMDGRLDVDADRLRPEWNDGRADIRLRDLLSMSSGLDFEEVYDPGTDATAMLFTPQDTGAYAASKPSTSTPGEVWSYSSGTTNIICDEVHEASGLGPEAAAELIFRPLGMTSAVLEPDVHGDMVCSSFMYATARDWARFGQWVLQDGVWDGERLLPEAWIADSTTPVDLDTDGTPYGWQWWLNTGAGGDMRMPSVPADAFWASGNEGQQVVVIPSEDLVVVRLGLTQDLGGIEWGLEALLADVIAAYG